MSDSDTENNASLGRVYEHPKAALDTVPNRSRVSVPLVMTLAVALGFLVGLMVSIIVAPALGLAFGLGGAMSFGAGAVALFLFRPEQPDEYESGFARTDEDVRKALAEIKARDK